MSKVVVSDERLRELVLMRQVRDRIDRDYAKPLDVAALARGVHMSAGHLSRQFKAALFDQLVEHGADIVQEPMDQPYGERDCAVCDPAGNLLRINQVD